MKGTWYVTSYVGKELGIVTRLCRKIMINEACVSRTLLRKFERHCRPRLPSSPTKTSTTIAFLRIGGEQNVTCDNAVIGAILRLISVSTGRQPNTDYFDDKCKGDDVDDDRDEVTNAIFIDPLLLRVLLGSLSTTVNNILNPRQANPAEDDRRCLHHVRLLPKSGNVGDATETTAMGWLELVKVVNNDENDDGHSSRASDDNENCECRNTIVRIRLAYICSTSHVGRSIFGNASTDYEDVQKQQRIDYLRKALVDEVVVEGVIFGIVLNLNDDDFGVYDYDNDSDRDCSDQHVAFFVVNEIVVVGDDGEGGGRRGEGASEFVHLSSRHDLEVTLDAYIPMTLESSGMNDTTIDVDYVCMGYNSVLEELVALARTIDDPRDIAPTAVVLTGCVGVGKSRMALLFERELSRVYDGSSQLTCVAMSAKDILLDEASSSFDHRVAYNVGDNCAEPRQLLIIDDLDVIIGDSDEMGSSFTTIGSDLQSEQLRALNAIVNLVDAAVVRKDFVLGICRTPLSRLPPQLARVGRFEKEVVMSSPTLMQRKDIFGYWLSTLPLAGKTTDVQRWADLLAPRTAGCVAADIRRVCADALTSAAARVPQSSSINDSIVTWEDVKEAAWTCIPSELSSLDVIQCPRYDESIDSKDGFKLAWKGFGGYEEEKKRLYRTVVRPWMYHITESTSLPGMSKPSGVLFHGPSGCGKSMAALALASSLGLNCVKVTASEVFNQWLGGSEQRLRSIFSRARVAAPCILFFDELDALAANREGGESDATSGVQSRILTTLLNEMDGITTAGGDQDILIVAATNRLDSIDAALLRPGRLEEHILLSHPKSTSINEILMIHTAKMPVDDSVDLVLFSRMLEESMTSTGAEIEGICRDACLIAIRRCSDNGKLDKYLSVSTSDFNEAFSRIKMRSYT